MTEIALGGRFTFPQTGFTDPSSEPNLLDLALPTFRTAWDAVGDLPAEPPDDDLAVRASWQSSKSRQASCSGSRA